MNIKLLPALLLACQMHAATIDLPQGTQIWQVKNYAHGLQFLDEFESTKWISLYGELSGGTFFNTDLTTLWWNFADSNYHLQYVVINDGQNNSKVVSLTGLDMFQGNLVLSAFNNTPVQRLDLYGHFGLPDEGSTMILLVLGLILLLAFYDQKTTR